MLRQARFLPEQTTKVGDANTMHDIHVRTADKPNLDIRLLQSRCFRSAWVTERLIPGRRIQPCTPEAGAHILWAWAYPGCGLISANLPQTCGTFVTRPMSFGSRTYPVPLRGLPLAYRAYSCRNLPCPRVLPYTLNALACPIRALKPFTPINIEYLRLGANVLETLQRSIDKVCAARAEDGCLLTPSAAITLLLCEKVCATSLYA